MGNILNKDQTQQEFVSKTAFYDGNNQPLFIEKSQLANNTPLYTYTNNIVQAILVNSQLVSQDGTPLFQSKAALNGDILTLLKQYTILGPNGEKLFASSDDVSALSTSVSLHTTEIATLTSNYNQINPTVVQLRSDVDGLLATVETLQQNYLSLSGSVGTINDQIGNLSGQLTSDLSYKYKFQQLNVGNDWSILTNNANLCVAKGTTQVVCLDSTGNVVYGTQNSEINKANGITFTPNVRYNGFLPTSTTTTTPAGYIRFNAL
jgi:uncharacterized protein YoxC